MRVNNGPNGDGAVVVTGMVGRRVGVSTSGRATGGKSGKGGSSLFGVTGAVAGCGCGLASTVGRIDARGTPEPNSVMSNRWASHRGTSDIETPLDAD